MEKLRILKKLHTDPLQKEVRGLAEYIKMKELFDTFF